MDSGWKRDELGNQNLGPVPVTGQDYLSMKFSSFVVTRVNLNLMFIPALVPCSSIDHSGVASN